MSKSNYNEILKKFSMPGQTWCQESLCQCCKLFSCINGPVLLVLWVEKMQVGSGSGNLRKNRVRSARVESGNVNKNLLHYLLQPINSETLLREQNEGPIWTQHALKPLYQLFLWLNLWLWSLLKSCLPLVYVIRQYPTRNRPYPRAYYPTYPTLPEKSTHH